jgi:hypothetical protein
MREDLLGAVALEALCEVKVGFILECDEKLGC